MYDTRELDIHFTNAHLHNKKIDIEFKNVIPGKINFSSDIMIHIMPVRILIIYNSQGSI